MWLQLPAAWGPQLVQQFLQPQQPISFSPELHTSSHTACLSLNCLESFNEAHKDLLRLSGNENSDVISSEQTWGNLTYWVNIEKNLFSNIVQVNELMDGDELIIRSGVFRFPREQILMSFPQLLQKVTTYLIRGTKLHISVSICHV